MSDQFRAAWVEIDLRAVQANVVELTRIAQPARMLAVVKADAYGHGAVPIARAAVEAGASWLGVALVEEGVALREAEVDAPILVLSEPAPDAAPAVVAHDLTPVVYTTDGIDLLAKAVVERGTDETLSVHLKVDTGMHRVGAAPAEAVALAQRVQLRTQLRLGGVCTHLAVADEPENSYTHEQLARFDAVIEELDGAGLRPELVHAANSAGLLAFPEARYDLVRVGIAMYGIAPVPELADRAQLQPALSLKARVSHVKTLPAGARLSYGLRYEMSRAGQVATVPIGYADGVPRNLAAVGGEVVIRGRRHPIAGTVTMDQMMVDIGHDVVEVGDEVVLIGRQGDAVVTAQEWAERLGTIPYEIVCGIGPRAPRSYV
jgi:alanine racemase